MALRAVIEHPKFARLKRILGLNKGPALGYLETLWHFAGRFTPCGDLGKYSDEEIEAWIEWDGAPGALVAAFVASGWVDKHPEHRLVVHDWHNHADDATKLAVKRAKRKFVTDISLHCPDTVATELPNKETQSGLPGPGAGPVPEPVPEPGGSAPSAPPADTPPAGMPMLNYARWLLETCALSITFQNQQAVAAAIGALSRELAIPAHSAAARLCELARDALRENARVDRFWFEDCRWRDTKRLSEGIRAQREPSREEAEAARADVLQSARDRKASGEYRSIGDVHRELLRSAGEWDAEDEKRWKKSVKG